MKGNSRLSMKPAKKTKLTSQSQFWEHSLATGIISMKLKSKKNLRRWLKSLNGLLSSPSGRISRKGRFMGLKYLTWNLNRLNGHKHPFKQLKGVKVDKNTRILETWLRSKKKSTRRMTKSKKTKLTKIWKMNT